MSSPACGVTYLAAGRDGPETPDPRRSPTPQRPAVAAGARSALREPASSTTSSTTIAPALSSGSLPFPHLGDCTQDGQPDGHSQSAIAARVAVSHSRRASWPRSAKPAPPGWPSCTNTVGRPVSGCRAVETPPMSQRSQVATSGSSPIAACSAACRAPGQRDGSRPARRSASSVSVYQTARVRRLRAGMSSGVESRMRPDGSFRR